MAFVFSLAAVLSLRELREQQAESAFTAVLHEIASANDTLHRIEDELIRSHAEHAQAAPQKLQAVTLHERYARINVLEQGRAEVLATLAELDTRREAQQQLYLAARRDRDLLDELKTKQRGAFTAEAGRSEQKRMDDLFLARRLRP